MNALGHLKDRIAIVGVGNTAYGIQFHPEVTYATMCRWTTTSVDKMNHPGARTPREHLAGWYQHDRDVNQWLGAFLKHWVNNAVIRSDGDTLNV